MDFYQRKSKTLAIIDKMIEAGAFSIEQIELAVLKETQMSKRFVTDYINKMVTSDRYKVCENGQVQIV